MTRILRIYRLGASRAVNVTKILPEDWEVVKADVIKNTSDYIIVKYEAIAKKGKYGRPVTTDGEVVE